MFDFNNPQSELPNSSPYAMALLLKFMEFSIILVNICLLPYIHKSKIFQCFAQSEDYLESLTRMHPTITVLSTNIVPIYKKGDATDPMNYHPITLLSTIGKFYAAMHLEKLAS